MAVRTFTVTLTDVGVGTVLAASPAYIPQAGTEGEHAATQIIFVLPAAYVSQDYNYRIEYDNGNGEAGFSGLQIPVTDTGRTTLTFLVPRELTAAGIAYVAVKIFTLDEERNPSLIAKSAPVRLHFDTSRSISDLGNSAFSDYEATFHTHSNFDVLNGLTDEDGKLAYDGTVLATHTHSNKTVIDGFTDSEGVLKYNGQTVIGGDDDGDFFKVNITPDYSSGTWVSDKSAAEIAQAMTHGKQVVCIRNGVAGDAVQIGWDTSPLSLLVRFVTSRVHLSIDSSNVVTMSGEFPDVTYEELLPQFSTSASYAVGDYVLYGSSYYKNIYGCTSAHAAGAWSPSDFTFVEPETIIPALVSRIKAVESGGSITIDSTVTQSSTNPVTSAGIYTALSDKQTKAITDTGGYFTTDTVEGALQEIGGQLAGLDAALEALL